MNINIKFLTELLQHIGIFFLLVYIFRYLLSAKYKVPPKTQNILNGILFAVIAGIGMISRIELGEGQYVDGRIILVGISAAYIHPIAGVVSALLVSMFRISMGGVGVPIGVIGICGGALVGVLFYKSNKSIPKIYSPLVLLILGLLLTLQAQVWIPILYPWDIAINLIKKVSLAGIISYPLGTLLIGLILNTLIQFEKRAVALKESEARWRSLTETSPDHILTLDTDLKIQFANFAAPGLTVKELIGTPLYQYVEGKEKQSGVKVILESVLNTGKQKSYETVYNTPGSEPMYYESSVVPRVLEGSKDIIGLTVSSRNISDRKNSEKKLLESEEKYRILFQRESDAIFIYDPDTTNILDANEATSKMYGYNHDELISMSCLKFSAEVKESTSAIDKIRGNGEINVPIRLHQKKDGTIFPVEISGYSLLLHKKNVMFAVSKDITERKKAEDQIKASLFEKETLLHEIHHRVKNNMQVINSLLKLQANSIQDNQIKDVLKDSQSRVYAMSAVHETLHGSEKLSEIDLKSYLSKITTAVFQTYSTDYRKVKLRGDVENSPVSINQAYPLGLIINELISNSLKYAFPDEREGEISVSIQRRDRELEMIINDDGIGIPDRLDWRNSKSLGLKLVQTLVENQLDGTIDMESKNGTKFTIKFNIET
ncbi:MAG: PAS domain S-box protein [Deltaproteobacteria bacterium]|nr:PAS domain S-box protein [Deltaproteobacteria bacterium]MBT4267980.1 PAS domain S-box protein [Deltaproteobacteria bacterium]MBT4642206.1 PAS domain S-box protein [Deltaproteobacteria bacterium]